MFGPKKLTAELRAKIVRSGGGPCAECDCPQFRIGSPEEKCADCGHPLARHHLK